MKTYETAGCAQCPLFCDQRAAAGLRGCIHPVAAQEGQGPEHGIGYTQRYQDRADADAGVPWPPHPDWCPLRRESFRVKLRSAEENPK